MREDTIARSYAETLFELGQRHGQQEALAAACSELETLLGTQPQFRRFLETPKLEREEKKRLLRDVFGKRFPPLFLNFLLLTLDKRRQRLLLEIMRAYRNLLDEHLGRVHVQVTVAREPDKGLRSELGKRLTQLLGRDVVPHFHVDRGILGGVVVRYGDRILDGSLRRRLLSMRRRLLAAALPGWKLEQA